MATTVSGSQMLIGLGIGLLLLIFMILKTKIHVFLALIIAAVIVGLVGGLPPSDTISAITSGFGGTLSSIGIIIGFGIMMGKMFEVSGAAERMALTFLKIFGKGREEWALSITGFLVSIPIFCDSGFVILSPLAKALSRRTKKSMVTLSIALAGGLVITHSLIPPTPGPLGVAGTFGVDVGKFILLGIVIAIPMAFVVTIYGRYLGKKIYQIPSEDGEKWERPAYQKAVLDNTTGETNQNLPSTLLSFAPLILPIILILFNTVLSAMKLTEGFYAVLIFIGQPVIAVGIGLLISIYTLTRGKDRKDVILELEDSMKSAGIIIFVTGGGGALGQVIKSAGVGDYIAKGIAATSIPVILLPFIIATLVRFVQGSGTVAMITAAGITAPIVEAAGGDMMLGAFAACIGSLFFSYFNDSFYWVVNRLSGIVETKEQVRVWSVTTTIAWAVGFVELIILNIFI
ncbi:gluconate:H+ symporter [Anaerocolumna aminovalerica]|jgi:GntP family gluconate:H+ symporter|uniref:Gluconate:H+ symporter, GntP family n=1 Tax=Anaerocolumna aminovalerica TaxID=1527 RepID=A0A1I5EEI4_9FIRM|nr:GntP family permease [Anaerocolumna aminovalerica]SFO09763.1 gluconate:H+ symporter, GntP family [Anaerocolumna aminovalerica]